MKHNNKKLELTLDTDVGLLEVATSFVRNSATYFGLGKKEAMSLELASEEIFSYMSNLFMSDAEMKIVYTDCSYFTQIDFYFRTSSLNLRSFNLTESVSLDDEESLKEMGLLIASHQVDKFKLSEMRDGNIKLALKKEKKYPRTEKEGAKAISLRGSLSVFTPGDEELKDFLQDVVSFYKEQDVPEFLFYPGKVLDMVANNECNVALLRDKKSLIAGGIIWCWNEEKTVECLGPYLFDEKKDAKDAFKLLDTCISDIGRSPIVCLLKRYPEITNVESNFEKLGNLFLYSNNNERTKKPVYFRQIREDLGTLVWCHSSFEEFLEEEYSRLVLPREIKLVRNVGEKRAEFSVLSVEFNRVTNSATLNPVCTGEDIETNLKKHLQLFQKEKLPNVFFNMDLGISWHTDFAEALIKLGFKPELIIPYAGERDLLIFQLDRELK